MYNPGEQEVMAGQFHAPSHPGVLKKKNNEWQNTSDIFFYSRIKRKTFVFAPIFHELNSKIEYFFYVHKRPISLKYYSQICLNLLVSTCPLPR